MKGRPFPPGLDVGTRVRRGPTHATNDIALSRSGPIRCGPCSVRRAPQRAYEKWVWRILELAPIPLLASQSLQPDGGYRLIEKTLAAEIAWR